MKSTKLLFSTLVLFALFISPSFADDCKVPVCDIPAKIEEMKTKGQAFRFETVSALRKIARSSKDMLVQKNLIEFGTLALQISQDQGDESWMIQECQALLDQARMGMLKYGPVDADEMLKLFNAQAGETAHYEVLTYWRAMIPTLDDANTLRNLIRFGAGAQEISKGKGESDYIAREAASLAREATARYGIVDPSHEGVFKATLKNPEMGAQEFRLVVLETTVNSGLLVGFVHAETNRVVHFFTSATFNLDLTILRANSTYQGYTASMALHYDRTKGTYEGWIRDTRYPEDIGVSASLIRSPGEYFNGPGAPSQITLRSLEGQYEGKIGKLVGTINIKRFGPKLFAADFKETGSGDEKAEIKYQTGSYNPVSGVLTLIKVENDVISQKLTLAFRAMDSSGVHAKLDGFNYGMNNEDPQVADFTWKREADEERPDPNFPKK